MNRPVKSAHSPETLNLLNIYRNLLNPCRDSIIFLDVTGDIFDVNQSCVELLGYTRDELCDLNLLDLIAPENLEEDPIQMSLLQTNGSDYKERNLHRKDGKVIQVEIQLQKVQDDILLGMLRDVTSQKEKQEFLRQMEDKYRLIVETSIEGICTLDENHLITYVNSRLASMLGYSVEEMLGKQIVNFLFEEDVANHQEMMELREKGHADPYERRFRRKDGTSLWMNVSPKPTMDGQGIFCGSFAMLTDISAQKRQEDIQKAHLHLLQFADQHLVDELLKETLDILGEFIDSPIGFFHFVDPNKLIFTRRVWSTKALRKHENYTGNNRHQPFDEIGVWLDCIHNRKSLIINDFAALAGKINLPSGHGGIERCLILPLIRNEQVVALLGLANKASDYSDKDIDLVSSFADPIWNIVERKIAEEKLRQNSLQYQTIISTSLDGFSICSASGKIMEANDSYCRMLGYTRDEILELSIPDIEGQEMPEETARHIQKMTKSGSERFETKHKCKDGKIISVEVNTTYMPEAGIFTTFTRDITERKRIEEALLENQELLSLFVSHSPIYAFIKDVTPTESRVIQVSDNYIQMVGVSSRDMAGKTMAELFPPEFASKITADDWAVVVENKVLELNEELNGRSYITIKFPIHQKGKTLLAGYTIDITDSKQAEIRHKAAFDALQISEEQLKEAQKIAHLGRWVYDIINDQLNWSDMIFEIFEIDPDKFDATYEAFLEAVHPDDRAEVNRVYNESLINHAPYEITHRLLMKDGRIKWVNEICRTEYDDQKQPVRSIGIVQEITNLRLAEEELIKRERLLQESQATAHVGSYIIDLVTGTNYWTKEAFRIFGMDENQPVPTIQEYRSLIHPDDVAPLYEMFGKSISTGAQFDLIYRIIHPSGDLRYVHSIGNPEKNAAGEVVRMVGTFQDVTESKRAEVVLTREKQRLTDIINATNVGTWELDLQTGENVLNARWAEMLGYNLEELSPTTYDTWVKLVHPDDLKLSGELEKRHVNGELETYECEVRLRHKNGNWVWILTKGKVIARSEEGKPLLMYGTHQDITERKLAEQELLQRDQLLEESQKIAHLGSFVRDMVTDQTYWTKETYRIFGLDEKLPAPIGKEFEKFIHPEDVEIESKLFTECIQTANSFDWVYRIIKNNGEIRFVRSIVNPLCSKDGKVIQISGTIQDVTENVLMENGIRESEKRFKSLYENIPLGYQSLDPNGYFLDINPAWAKLLGYSPEEVIGRWFGDFLVDEEVDLFKQRFPMFKVTGAVHDIEFHMKHKNGHTVTVNFNGQIGYDAWGKVERTYCNLVDITKRKEMEENLQASLAEKEVLIREVHHRVKNNLAAILGLMDMERQSTTDLTAKNLLTELSNRIKSMSTVHEKLYRSESLSKIDFQDYLTSFVSHLRTSLRTSNEIISTVDARGIELSLDLAVPCGLIVNELVTNSMKYAFPEGKPGNQHDKGCGINISMKEESGKYILTVSDNGVGLPDELEWRESKTLGLRLVRMLGEHQLGGFVELDTSHGLLVKIEFDSNSRE